MAPMLLTNQICFSYFCRRSPGDYFFQTVLNFNHWFQTRTFLSLILVHKVNWPLPLAAMFLADQIYLIFPSDHFC